MQTGTMISRRALILGLGGGPLAAMGAPGVLRAAPGAPARLVGTVRELTVALAACSGGETVALAGGAWEPLTLEGVRFETPVTLVPDTPDDPPVLPRALLRDCAGLQMRGLRFAYRFTEGENWRESPFRVLSSRAVSFTECSFVGDAGAGEARGIDITGAPWGTGPRIRTSTDCHVLRCYITGFRQGLVFAESSSCSAQGCRLEGNGNDNLRLVEVQDMLVDGNYFGQQASHPDEPFHNDHIHHFNSNATTQSVRVAITRNMLYSDRDAVRDSAGMMLQNFLDTPLQDWRVEGNVVIGRARHGISLWPVDGAVLRHNTLIRWHRLGPAEQNVRAYRGDTPMLNVRKGSRDVLVEGNITVLPFSASKSQVVNRGNIAIPPERYASAFVQPDPDDPRGWKVRADGIGAGFGAPLMW